MKPPKKYSNLNKDEIKQIKKVLGITKIDDIDVTIFKELREKLKKLKDKRCKGKISFKIWDIVICTIIASFADNNTWKEIKNYVEDNYKWFKSFLQMTGGVPSEDTYERVMGTIHAEDLNQILYNFYVEISMKKDNENNNIEPDINSFDGRNNNGSKRKETLYNDEKKPLNCLNGYSCKTGYCFITKQIDEKTNEIPTIENEIKKRDLTNVIVTWDALNSQKANVAAVINSHGDYIVPIKSNHETFYENLKEYFEAEQCSKIKSGTSDSKYYFYSEKSHSSIIRYEYFVTKDIDWYYKIKDWKGVKSFGLVRKTITKKEKIKNEKSNDKNKYTIKTIKTIEDRYYISSRGIDVEEFAKVTRAEWNIENKIHWHLDYTFLQDKNTTTNKNALLSLEVIHKFVLAILDKVKVKYGNQSLRCIRKHISHNIEEFFPELVAYLILA